MKQAICFYTLFIFSLAACATTTRQLPTATPVLSSTPTHTLTPTSTPTNTPQPTMTSCVTDPSSDSTLRPVQDRASTLVPGAKVTWYDGFDCDLLHNEWGLGHENPTMKTIIDDGVLKISQQKVENTWTGLGHTSSGLGDNKGMLLLFQYEAGTTAPLFIYTGTWQSPGYRRWGLGITADPQPGWEGWEGSRWMGSSLPGNVLRPDTPFYLQISMNNNGEVTMKVWEKDNPNNHADFKRQMPASWVGRRWISLFQLYEGTLEIDEYFEFSLEKS
jgi:hypothetical protein